MPAGLTLPAHVAPVVPHLRDHRIVELTEVVEQTGRSCDSMMWAACNMWFASSSTPRLCSSTCVLLQLCCSRCDPGCAGTPYSARRRKTAFQMDTPRDLA